VRLPSVAGWIVNPGAMQSRRQSVAVKTADGVATGIVRTSITRWIRCAFSRRMSSSVERVGCPIVEMTSVGIPSRRPSLPRRFG